ncbi:phage tail protein, partial [Kluyvera sp. Nf5]
NRRVDNTGNWVYDGEKIIPRVYTPQELQTQAESQKTRLLADIATRIAPLQDAVELGIASDEEVETLTALKKYRVLVNRVDPAAPVWPEQ